MRVNGIIPRFHFSVTFVVLTFDYSVVHIVDPYELKNLEQKFIFKIGTLNLMIFTHCTNAFFHSTNLFFFFSAHVTMFPQFDI